MRLYTHKQGSWLLYPYKPQGEQKYTSPEDYRLLCEYTHTHKNTLQYLHKWRCTTLRKTPGTQSHITVVTQPWAQSRWEERKVEMRGKTEWEAEVRTKRDVRREAGDDEWEGTRLSCCNSFQTRLLREFSLTSSERKSNPPICPPNTLSDPSLILPSASGKHPRHGLLLLHVHVAIVRHA